MYLGTTVSSVMRSTVLALVVVSAWLPVQAQAYVYLEVHLENGLVLKGNTVTDYDLGGLISKSKPSIPVARDLAHPDVTAKWVRQVTIRPDGVTALESVFEGEWIVKQVSFESLEQYNEQFKQTPFEIEEIISAKVDPRLSDQEAFETYKDSIRHISEREGLGVVTQKVAISKDGTVLAIVSLGDRRGAEDWQEALDSVEKILEVTIGNAPFLKVKETCQDDLI